MWAQPSLEAPIPARLRDDLSGRLGSLIFLLGRHPHTGRPRLRRHGALALETGLNLGVRPILRTVHDLPEIPELMARLSGGSHRMRQQACAVGARGGLPRGRQHQVLVLWELALPLPPESVCVV